MVFLLCLLVVVSTSFCLGAWVCMFVVYWSVLLWCFCEVLLVLVLCFCDVVLVLFLCDRGAAGVLVGCDWGVVGVVAVLLRCGCGVVAESGRGWCGDRVGISGVDGSLKKEMDRMRGRVCTSRVGG